MKTQRIGIRKALTLLFSALLATSLCVPELSWAQATADVGVATEQELRDAVVAGGSVMLGADIALSKTLEIPKGAAVDIDLAGFDVSVGGARINAILNKGELTLRDSGDGGAVSGLNAVNNQGTLTVEGGALAGTNTGIYVGGGTTTVRGGAVSSSGSAALLVQGGTASIEGGSFVAPSGGAAVELGSDGASLAVSGGAFKPGSALVSNSNTTGNRLTLADGVDFSLSPDAEGYYTVGDQGTAARIGSVDYASLVAALEAAGSGDEVVLQRDVLVPCKLFVGFSGTVDLNGNQVREPFGESRLVVESAATLRNGSIESAGDALFVSGSASAVFDGLTVTAGNRALWASAGSVSIKSGTYRSTGAGVCALNAAPNVSITIDAATVTNGKDADQAIVKGGKLTLFGEAAWSGDTCTVYSTADMVESPSGVKYATIGEALAAGETVLSLTRTVVHADDVTIPSGTSLELSLGAHRYGGSFVNDGSLILAADDLSGGVTGTVSGSGRLVVNGGTYVSDVSGSVGEDFVAVARDGAFEVVRVAARIGDAKFATLEDAVTAADGVAGSPTTIVVARDRADQDELDIPAGKHLVIDWNGHSFRGVPVGSEGTVTAGMRVQAGSEVTLRNGTMTPPVGALAYYPVNNEGTLVLSNMDIEGDSVNALVRSCGNLTVKDSVIENAGDYSSAAGYDGGFGLLCQYYEYAGGGDQAGRMTTDISSSTIAGGFGGMLVVGGQNADRVTEVSVSSGSILGARADAIVVENGSAGDAPKISLTGGTYSSDVSAYFSTDKYAQDETGAVVARAYAVSYDLSGGTLPEGAGNPASYTWFDGDVTLANPVRFGYTFAGWTGTGLAAPSLDVRIPANSTGERAYAATWRADAATIVFHANGGSSVVELSGVTDQQIGDRALPTPSRSGYAFAGWYDNEALAGEALARLPEAFPAGVTAYWAKWNFLPLPDGSIQVEVPAAPVDGATGVTISQEGAAQAARSARAALDTIKAGGVPAGMDERDALAVRQTLSTVASDGDRVTVVVSVRASRLDAVAEAERDAIEGVRAQGETAAAYFDLGIVMTVRVEHGDGTEHRAQASLSAVQEPVSFELHVDPALIKGKDARIAHVHEGVAEVVQPEGVDREQGIARFRAERFSTYALLVSDAKTVDAGGKPLPAPLPSEPPRAAALAPTGDGFAGAFALGFALLGAAALGLAGIACRRRA